jgi:uncharacterized Zn finger protein
VRENAGAKGRRYLGEGRLTVEHVGDVSVRARCRGGGTVYQLGWSAAGGWRCDCPARKECAHLVALKSVVAVGRRS